MYRQSEKIILKQQYLLHMSWQYGELRHSSSGRQPNFAALNRERRWTWWSPCCGRVTITLGIGPHFSCKCYLYATFLIRWSWAIDLQKLLKVISSRSMHIFDIFPRSIVCSFIVSMICSEILVEIVQFSYRTCIWQPMWRCNPSFVQENSSS